MGMLGDIIWYVSMFGCAVLIAGIGVYAKKLDKPMWFWSGSNVDPASITDVKAYNLENSRMWKWYSVWFWVAGITWYWSETIALIAVVLGSTVGIGLLIASYLKIEKKYTKTGL